MGTGDVQLVVGLKRGIKGLIQRLPPNGWIVTNDGGYYKSGAQYMIWAPGWSQAAWSDSHMQKQVQAAKAGQDPPRDPGYRT